ncbi:MAG: Rid family detoxifying hydrolase [Pseudomonadota bacterium]
MTKKATLFYLILFCAGCAQSQSDKFEILSTKEHESRNLPFSQAIKAGGFIFLSGEIGTLPGSMELVPGGIKAETRQIMENMSGTLGRAGASMNDVVKCTVFIEDMSLWPQMNEIYVTYFPNHKPARSAVGADGIALGGAVEIECIALAPD